MGNTAVISQMEVRSRRLAIGEVAVMVASDQGEQSKRLELVNELGIVQFFVAGEVGCEEDLC
ncbi:hypothetical protein D3C85_1801350 [compost metagenome]